MRARLFFAVVAFAGTLSVAADEPRPTVDAYRSAFLAQCEERGADQLAACECGFDEWSRSLSDPSAEDAMAAARVMAGQVKSVRDFETSVTAMSRLTTAMLSCASSDRYGELENAEELIDLVESGAEPFDSGEVDFTGVLGGAEAGDEVPPPAPRGSAVILDEDGKVLRSEPSVVVDMDTVSWDDSLSRIEKAGPLETPLADYRQAFSHRCTEVDKLEREACECAWEGLVAAANGLDGSKERLAAYLSVATDPDYAAYDPGLLGEAMEVFAVYAANRQACFPIPDFSIPAE